MSKKRTVIITSIFFSVMILLTFCSRTVYRSMLPKVNVTNPFGGTLTYNMGTSDFELYTENVLYEYIPFRLNGSLSVLETYAEEGKRIAAGDALVKETKFYYSLHSYLSNGQSEPMRALDEAGNPSSINAASVVMQPGVAQQTDELVFYFDKPVIGIRLLQEPFYSSEIIAFADDYYLELEIADQQPGIENAMMVEEMNFLEGFRDGGAMILSPDTMEAVFTSTHNAPPVISGIEDGGQYFTTQKVTVKDKDLESVTLNGEAVAFSGDSAVVTLSGDEDKEYTIFAIRTMPCREQM